MTIAKKLSRGPRDPQRSGWLGRILRAVGVLALLPACGVEEVLLEPFRGETPRERYEESLARAGLTGSAVVRAWHLAGEQAFLGAVEVAPPLLEEVWLPAEEPMALGYVIDAKRGQRIDLQVRTDDAVSQIFIELFRVDDPGDEESELLVEWADAWERGLTYNARASSRYVVRIQPELLAGGSFEVSINVGPSLAFPVDGGSTENVKSFFGDIRDGGARDHHGVDIFAPRGTPVRAAAAGEVYRVDVTGLGGKVVWVRNGDQREYYAHLDSQMVRNGQTVKVGDVLGLVGNTGNARTTPPHLHFGVYVRRGGAVDPYPFIYETGGEPATLTVSRDAFLETLRVRDNGSVLRAAPRSNATALAELPPQLPLRVMGGTGEWFRVRLPTGVEGYALGHQLEAATSPLGQETVPGRLVMRNAPDEAARRVRGIGGDQVVSVLGRSGSWLWVAADEGSVRGWLALDVE